MEQIFVLERPNTIFHTAAYKHVGLVEDNPVQSFKNNVIGTFNLAKISIKNKVENFVNISTDKAVNPISMMGSTKRLAEIIIQHLSEFKLNWPKTFPATPFANLESFFTFAFISFFITSNISLKLLYLPLVGNLSCL